MQLLMLRHSPKIFQSKEFMLKVSKMMEALFLETCQLSKVKVHLLVGYFRFGIGSVDDKILDRMIHHGLNNHQVM
jgi:hypothetical protein